MSKTDGMGEGLSQGAGAKRCCVPGDKAGIESTRRKSGSQMKSIGRGAVLSAEVYPIRRVLVRITLCIDHPSLCPNLERPKPDPTPADSKAGLELSPRPKLASPVNRQGCGAPIALTYVPALHSTQGLLDVQYVPACRRWARNSCPFTPADLLHLPAVVGTVDGAVVNGPFCRGQRIVVEFSIKFLVSCSREGDNGPGLELWLVARKQRDR